MGRFPEWYLLLRAARYMGVPPWELARMPAAWRNYALAAENAEISAQNEAMEAAQRGKK